jgi:hypothetical protein
MRGLPIVLDTLRELYTTFPEIRVLLVSNENRRVMVDILTRLVGRGVEDARPSIEASVASVMGAGYHVTRRAPDTTPLVPRRPGDHRAPEPDQILGRVTADSQRGRILLAYWEAGSSGFTDDEAAQAAKIPDRSCWWKRSSELRQAGLIEPIKDADDNPMTRLSEFSGSARVVCVITPEGEAVAAGLEP